MTSTLTTTSCSLNFDPVTPAGPQCFINTFYYFVKKKSHYFNLISGKGSQGATSGNVDYLDASKSPVAGASGSDTSSPRPGTASSSASSVPQGPRQQKPGQAQKKKKKKGSRW